MHKEKGGSILNQVSHNKELENEKEKLNKLVDEALNKGIPITQDEAVIAQNRKVDVLVVKIQKEKELHRKNQWER